MTIDQLRDAIIKEFSPMWELNDKAHRVEHFEDVFQCGMYINDKLELGYEPKLILFAAYFHDLFAWSRYNHHEMAFHWMTTTDFPLILDNLNPKETMIVAWGCHQHRASYKGEFKGKFCELINAADRGRPGNISSMLDRAIKYREKKHPEMSRDQRYVDAIKHLHDKYGFQGYARYPAIYTNLFGVELEQQRAEINDLYKGIR